ncbi:hypothetical protein KP509_27G057000 [Ceratopteris richardii]|uniref:Cadherin-like beta-sandwich-like domain-containing protein n=1 Tax=Ceratopteris richardii TaxID=49495 RepID=A0A8T2RGJ0_CERRI|nr:hypothetical protein KP509_27G057000 [Ceratopteris richardii]KAH7295602.1 hypothetical protein KP509_27G057000 [Ceratopteris richardii]
MRHCMASPLGLCILLLLISCSQSISYQPSSSSFRPCFHTRHALLSNISLSAANLTPLFDPLVFNYTATIPFEVSAVQVSASIPHHEFNTSYYRLYVNGSPTEAGVASSDISLGDYGSTVIIPVVLHVDGCLPSTYTLSITRGLVESHKRKKDGHTVTDASEYLEENHKYKYWRAKLAEDHRKQVNCC